MRSAFGLDIFVFVLFLFLSKAINVALGIPDLTPALTQTVQAHSLEGFAIDEGLVLLRQSQFDLQNV